MNKEKILNNNEISSYIKDFYLGNIDEISIGDKYYEYKLYSSASGFYGAYLNKHYDDLDTIRKSECLTKLAKCYLNQLDKNYSDWQMNITYSLLKYAIIYDPTNIDARYTLGHCYVKQNNFKDACFEFEYIVMNMDKFNKNLPDNKINEIIYNSIINAYRLSNNFKSVKFKAFNQKVLEYSAKNIKNIPKDVYLLITAELLLNEQRINDFEKTLLSL